MKIYNEKVFWDLYYFFNYNNIMSLPYITKIILNSSCGKFFFDKKKMNFFFNDLFNICFQKPLFIKSKKSISDFNLKKNDNISLKVTLRKKNMYNFLYKFLNISLSQINKFSGFLNNFDKFGNFNFGIEDHSIFPEIIFNKLDFLVGLNINIIFKNSNPLISFKILKFLNFPFN